MQTVAIRPQSSILPRGVPAGVIVSFRGKSPWIAMKSGARHLQSDQKGAVELAKDPGVLDRLRFLLDA
ncbi:hypothetical protein P6F26_14860 [Roseibacterium sp. SDUM158017]|uniref:hypothetical protein n=1 Tax=Roseicyclus salinarum TaxID=3036773 RepID=UPI00241529DA|nr:hypothetical protein [Roseibacterium sp. SDUM158017]MDG4649723.1 hypothetical protein [Roseibacterium sp. SDUM158017]